MRCLCGATDCPSCGPAQGYEVIRARNKRGDYIYVNPKDEDEDEDDKISDEDDKTSDENG